VSILLLHYFPKYFNICRMQAEERLVRISEYIQRVEFASLKEFAMELGVSVSTVRRDLTVLEATGVLRRTHGGARLINPKSDEYAFSARDTRQLTEKEAIGRRCAELVQPNQSVIMDAGTTVFHVARHLEERRPQIITNSLPVANLYASAGPVEVVLSGGVLYPRLGVLVGPLAVESFSKMHADVAIMSAGGITEEGLTNSHGLLIEIQKAMMQAASRVIFCLDHTKFGRKSMAFLCRVEEIDVLVTNEAAPIQLIEALKQKGVDVIVASGA
jgi:DeoR/GlpR family transcriptional regulator of sugar metabolism